MLASSLKIKTALAVGTVSMFICVIFIFFAHRTGLSLLRQMELLKAQVTVEMVKGILEHAMMDKDREHVRHTLHESSNSPDVVNAFLLRADGTVSLQARGSSLIKRIPVELFSYIPGMNGEKYFTTSENDSVFEYVVLPVGNQQRCFQCHSQPDSIRGYVGVKLNVHDVRQLTYQHRTSNIAMTILGFCGLGVIVYTGLLLLVIHPITGLHNHIGAIKQDIQRLEGGTAVEIPVLEEPRRKDEIADLTRDFNDLLLQLNRAHAKVHDLHQQRLTQADRLATAGQMAASMAHEIKNPIAGVLSALQVFQKTVPEGDARKEIVSEMVTQLERVSRTVNDLLSYARPTPPLFEQICVEEVIQRTAALLQTSMQRRRITLQYRTSDGGATIEADRRQLQQVLWNVMLNAVQSMEASGTLSVDVSQINSDVQIDISDTGVGIPTSQLEQIFVPFFTTKREGTGLGMTISKRIVEEHHGTLTLRSIVGEGTTITIRLPRHQSVMG